MVIFAKDVISLWLSAVLNFAVLPALCLGAALVDILLASDRTVFVVVRFGLSMPALQSSNANGTPTCTKVSDTQTLVGFDGSNLVGPRFLGPSSASPISKTRSSSGSLSKGRSSWKPLWNAALSVPSTSSPGSSLSRSIFTRSIGTKLTRSSGVWSVIRCSLLPCIFLIN